jgi:hypothetical protein
MSPINKIIPVSIALDKVIDVESINMDQNIETDIKKEACEANPWSVDDASVFLKYCCPEWWVMKFVTWGSKISLILLKKD